MSTRFATSSYGHSESRNRERSCGSCGRGVSLSLTSSPHGPYVLHGAFYALPCIHVAAWCRVRAPDQERVVAAGRMGLESGTKVQSSLPDRRKVTVPFGFRTEEALLNPGQRPAASTTPPTTTTKIEMNLRHLNLVGHCTMCMVPVAALRSVSSRSTASLHGNSRCVDPFDLSMAQTGARWPAQSSRYMMTNVIMRRGQYQHHRVALDARGEK